MMLCRLYRFMISHAADSDARLDRFTRRHVFRCAGCRGFYQQWQTLGHGLRSQAAGRRRVSSQVTEQISCAAAGRPQPRVAVSSGLRLATAACLIIAALMGFTIVTRTHRSGGPAAMPTPAIGLTEAHLRSTWTRLVRHPLANELDHLTADTESGVRFLVACLDVSPAEEPVPPR